MTNDIRAKNQSIELERALKFWEMREDLIVYLNTFSSALADLGSHGMSAELYSLAYRIKSIINSTEAPLKEQEG